ncbi:D-arabinitol 4-dehydrogenase [Serratia ficaria]|uniref:D-arabinitol 4-dehydrogenase n=1 Tax=Serratia ficaria TaxID=61651 RepID=UPI0021788E59|nr:D-arabinitol 4-dehydrogenase [Serratia ficaria]CAI0713751.1 Mannitol 2-dehydrogenase [Serratia ficaria]CAI0758101.1 Mannitol 2-dehydrogenase [Serratia ficaria]CAI1836919.1 Mannitol 2-dehydrogenase [Serratia ficaria]CAI2399193.1 Mannitol 2-dehydrogenase [Serratia ficaria]CAI2447538.1 Mannitol 2-dehydrogenase [Serratia ficaria]
MPQTHSTPAVWLHIGAGSFHRAHQAWYLHRLRLAGDRRWSIALANIRDDAAPLLAALEAQHGEYVLETVTPHGERSYETITSIQTIVPWDAELAALTAEGARPETRVISFTVTEAGYYLDNQFNLDRQHADIQADLHGACRTIYGALTQLLQRRMQLNGDPVTLLNCDNLRHNGDRFRRGLMQFLQLRREDALIDWIERCTRCPNTMVDRITPRPSPEVAVRVAEATGIRDRAPVMAESFIQWVIEDNFAAGRPALEQVGVELVDSVLPYEEAKIRILNASHSCIAWAGTLIGQRFIHESTRTDAIRQMACDYLTQDVIPCLTPSPIDLTDYRDRVLERFGNPDIRDTNQRVAADGFSKIPGFIVPTLSECFQRGETPQATAMLPALFFVFMRRWHQGRLPYDYQDGMLDAPAVQRMFEAADPLAVYAADEALFGALAHNAGFTQLLRHAVERVNRWLGE